MAKLKFYCKNCEAEFEAWSSDNRVYCGRECASHTMFSKGQNPWNKGANIQTNTGRTHFKGNTIPWNKGKLITLRCEFCNTAFDVHPCMENGARFCSHKCFTDWRKETGAIRGDNHPNWGKERPGLRGENNVNWKGGVSKANSNRWSDNEYLHWRKAVFHRDDYTCQECGERGCYLEAHHIKSWRDYEELRYEIDNGITYCKNCHIKLDDRRMG